MKKILLFFLTLSFLGVIFYVSQNKVYSYACDEGYYCSSSGGSLTMWYKNAINGVCNSRVWSWPCSGSDSSCSGSISVSGYPSSSACYAGTGWYTYSAGCCNKRPCVSTCKTGCTPGNCSDGYTKTDNGCSKTTTVSCSNEGSNCPPSAGCGGSSDKCYYIETNLSFKRKDLTTDGPSSITMTVDGKPVELSTDPNNPTVIKRLATGSNNVQLATPTFEPRDDSDGGGYAFQVDNYGVNNEWINPSFNCSSLTSEDFCTESSSNTITFAPKSKTANEVLKEGSKGKISVSYYTIDMCDTNKKYSTARVGYYLVDTIPDIPTPCIPGTETCKILADIGIDSTIKGCASTTYTGNEANNPLHFTASITDTNGANDIQSIIIWLTKGSTIPATATTSSSCNSGYYMAADNICCPENTSYTDGMCSSTVKPKSCPGAYYLSNGVCCQVGFVSNGSACVHPPLSVKKTLSCTTLGNYTLVGSTSTTNICCPTGSGYIKNTCQSTLRPATCISGYYETGTGSSNCCPNETTYLRNGTCSSMITNYYNGLSSDIGILIMKNGPSWDSSYIYGLNTTNQWKLISSDSNGNKYLRIDGNKAVKILNVNTTQSTNVLFDLKLEFLQESGISGIFSTYIAGIDSNMINKNTIDQSYITKVFNWGIDLVNPITSSLTQTVNDTTKVNITWGASDVGSGLDKVLLSPYRVGGLKAASPVTLFNKNLVNLGSITPPLLPENTDVNIGRYDDNSTSWTFTNNTGEKDLMDIGENENGKIDVYATAYDKACNVSSNYTSIDLDPWITTRGGSLYSKGIITSSPKDVTTSTALKGGVLRNFTDTQLGLLDTGTELISSRDFSLIHVAHSNTGAVEALGAYDSNNVKNTWFDSLFKEFTANRSSLQSLSKVTDACNSTACYLYSGDEDINIPSNYTCTKPILFISAGNINISPNIYVSNTANSLSGCIFLAKKNINILPGDYASQGSTTVKYDYIEGFFIAEQQIIFQFGDSAQAIRDGIEIKGSVEAFGTNVSGGNAIQIDRSLRLANQTNPTVVMTYDNRYYTLSQLFFGTNIPTYRQEVGFKNF